MSGADQAEDWGARLSRARAVLAAQPFSAMLGAQPTALSADGVELRLPVSDALAQQHGFVHGGLVACLADSTLAFAGGLRPAGRVVTVEMKLNYVWPAVGEALPAVGRTISAGRKQAVARCEVFAVASGVERLCAAAQGTIVAVGAPSDAASKSSPEEDRMAAHGTFHRPSIGRPAARALGRPAAIGPAVAAWLCALRAALRARSTRRSLAEMDDRKQADIGLSRAEALREAGRWPWDLSPPADPTRWGPRP